MSENTATDYARLRMRVRQAKAERLRAELALVEAKYAGQDEADLAIIARDEQRRAS